MLKSMSGMIDAAVAMRAVLGADSPAHAPWLTALGSAADTVAAGCPLLVEAMRCVRVSNTFFLFVSFCL
jgi:hypothetical protein